MSSPQGEYQRVPSKAQYLENGPEVEQFGSEPQTILQKCRTMQMLSHWLLAFTVVIFILNLAWTTVLVSDDVGGLNLQSQEASTHCKPPERNLATLA